MKRSVVLGLVIILLAFGLAAAPAANARELECDGPVQAVPAEQQLCP